MLRSVSSSIIHLADINPTLPPWLKAAITPQADQYFCFPWTGPIRGNPSEAKAKRAVNDAF